MGLANVEREVLAFLLKGKSSLPTDHTVIAHEVLDVILLSS